MPITTLIHCCSQRQKNLNQTFFCLIYLFFGKLEHNKAVYCPNVHNKVRICLIVTFSIPTLTSPLARNSVVLDIVPPVNGKPPYKRLSLVTLQSLLLKLLLFLHTLFPPAKRAHSSLTGSESQLLMMSEWEDHILLCLVLPKKLLAHKCWQMRDKKGSLVGSTLRSVVATWSLRGAWNSLWDVSFSSSQPPALKQGPFVLNTTERDSSVQQISFLFLIASPNPNSSACVLNFKV